MNNCTKKLLMKAEKHNNRTHTSESNATQNKLHIESIYYITQSNLLLIVVFPHSLSNKTDLPFLIPWESVSCVQRPT